MVLYHVVFFVFFFKQKTAYEMRISDWSSDVCSSDLIMGITLREASEKVGVTRQTLMKAIKTGRVSAEKSDNGEWRIKPVELFRFWPPVTGVKQPFKPNITTGKLPGFKHTNSYFGTQLPTLVQHGNPWWEQPTQPTQTTER